MIHIVLKVKFSKFQKVDFDKSVLLVERDRIGGAGIYDGALSSKTFWEISKEFASFCKKPLML